MRGAAAGREAPTGAGADQGAGQADAENEHASRAGWRWPSCITPRPAEATPAFAAFERSVQVRSRIGVFEKP